MVFVSDIIYSLVPAVVRLARFQSQIIEFKVSAKEVVAERRSNMFTLTQKPLLPNVVFTVKIWIN